MLLGYLARKPVVLEHHGYQSTCPNGLLIHEPERSVCPGYYLQGRHLECLKCQSKEMPSWKAAIHLLMMGPRYLLSRSVAANISITNHVLERQSLPRSTAIYYGIEDSAPLSSETYVRRSGKLSFAYLGRLVAEKGIPIFLESVRLLKEEGFVFDIKLVGEGPQRAEIERLIQEKQIQDSVTITGFLTGNALHEMMQRVAVVVMPSVWEETAGLAAIEQMMRGRLVIASKIGGLAEVVGEAGLLSPPGDPIALAECMKKVIQNPALIETFGKNARDRAATLFKRSRMVEEHARVYLHLVDSKPR
jgi:glycosyltransferase involved in cell wall biosynthesis